MNRKVTIFGGVVLFILFLLVLISIYLENRNEEMYNDSLMSNYEYDIIIESNSTLQNVTLYLPVPVFGNESEVGLEMVNGDYYNKPSNWNLSLEDTEHDQGKDIRKFLDCSPCFKGTFKMLQNAGL